MQQVVVSFTSITGVPAGIVSASFTLVFSITAGIIKKLLSATIKKKEKAQSNTHAGKKYTQ